MPTQTPKLATPKFILKLIIAKTNPVFNSVIFYNSIPCYKIAYFFRTKFLKRNPKMHLPLNAAACTICFGLALPACIALFPQYATVSALFIILQLPNFVGVIDVPGWLVGSWLVGRLVGSW